MGRYNSEAWLLRRVSSSEDGGSKRSAAFAETGGVWPCRVVYPRGEEVGGAAANQVTAATIDLMATEGEVTAADRLRVGTVTWDVLAVLPPANGEENGGVTVNVRLVK